MDKASTIFLAVSLVIIMLGMGLSLTIDDFKRIFIKPKAVILGVSNNSITLSWFSISFYIPFKT